MSNDGRWQKDAADQNFDYMFKLHTSSSSSADYIDKIPLVNSRVA